MSSFGIGGTNAHVVLEEPPPVEAAAPSRAVQLLLLSARTAGELEEMTSRLARHLQAKPDICVADVAYTLQVGRKEFPYRRMALCRSREEAVSALEARTPQRVVTALASSSARPIVFLFPGQGSQHVDMGAGLYESERCFRDAVDRCADFLRPQLGLDLRSAMFSRDGQAAEAQLERTELAQPALFIIAYALAQQLSSFGIRPRAMIGHSIGEYVAACLAGVFALEDALTLVAERGRLMQSMPPGGMLAVELAERELLPLLGENLTLAAVNAPSLCVVAGPITAIRTMQEQLSGRGIACRRLHTSHAFHSRFMDPILEPFLQRVHAATRNPPAIPFVSNVTGSWIAAEQATDPQYWASHLRHTVRFSEGVRQLMREGDNVFLEVGPGQGLAGLVRRHFDRGAEPVIMSALRHAGDPRDDSAQLLETVGRLWLAGACRKPELRDAQEKRRRIPLPTYPFERRRFWIDPAVPGEADDHTASPPKTEGNATVDGWFFAPVWRRRVDPFTPVRTVVDGACWLVFADGCGLGDSLAEQLRMGGCRVFTVSAGSAFARRGDDYFVLDASKPEHYDRLIGELARFGHEPRNIVHLWTVDANGAAGDWDTVQSLGFFSLMFLVQAAGRQGWTEKLALHVVSSRMQRVFDDEVSRPEKATILGPVRVVPKEFPGIRCRSIDVVQPSSGRWHDTGCLDRLVAELLSESFASATAIRDGQVWEQAFAPVELREPGGVPARLRAGGTYLITGGLGSMGLAFARCLARDARARMILLGRTGLPPEAEWDGLLRRSAPDGDETVRGRTAAPCVIAFDPVKASDLVQSLEQRAQAGAPLLDIDGDARLQMLLHAFCSGLIGRYLRDGGIALQDGGCLSREEMRERLHIQPPFARLFSFLLGCLGEDGIISIDGDRIEVCRNLTAEALAETRQAILVEYPEFRGLVDLLEHCTARYRQALSGEIPSISVLYPDGTSTLMDARSEIRRNTPGMVFISR